MPMDVEPYIKGYNLAKHLKKKLIRFKNMLFNIFIFSSFAIFKYF